MVLRLLELLHPTVLASLPPEVSLLVFSSGSSPESLCATDERYGSSSASRRGGH